MSSISVDTASTPCRAARRSTRFSHCLLKIVCVTNDDAGEDTGDGSRERDLVEGFIADLPEVVLQSAILSVPGDSIATMTASAHDVAAALRERLPGLGVMKLHKLLYYAQGHHLAAFDRTLFSESIRAWDMGPVVAEFWRDEDRGEPRPEPHALGEAELNTIGYVASQYGRLNGSQLERLTHTEQPWRAGDARRKVGDSDRIEQEWIRRHFLAEAATSDEEQESLDPSVISASLSNTQLPAGPGGYDDIGALLTKLARA
jgi:uncharacterized phage-associated protein